MDLDRMYAINISERNHYILRTIARQRALLRLASREDGFQILKVRVPRCTRC